MDVLSIRVGSVVKEELESGHWINAVQYRDLSNKASNYVISYHDSGGPFNTLRANWSASPGFREKSRPDNLCVCVCVCVCVRVCGVLTDHTAQSM